MNITNEVKVSFQKNKPEKTLTLKDASYLTWYVVEDPAGETYVAIKTYSTVQVEPAFILIGSEGEMLWSNSDGSDYKVLNESAEVNIKVYPQ